MIRETYRSLDGKRTAELTIDSGRVWAEGLNWNSDGTVRATEKMRFRNRLEVIEGEAHIHRVAETEARAFCERWVSDRAWGSTPW